MPRLPSSSGVWWALWKDARLSLAGLSPPALAQLQQLSLCGDGTGCHSDAALWRHTASKGGAGPGANPLGPSSCQLETGGSSVKLPKGTAY